MKRETIKFIVTIIISVILGVIFLFKTGSVFNTSLFMFTVFILATIDLFILLSRKKRIGVGQLVVQMDTMGDDLLRWELDISLDDLSKMDYIYVDVVRK